MRGNFPLLFLKEASSMHTRLCSDLACNCINQSSCVLVGQHDNVSKLLSTFVDSRVTNLVLATCHA